MPLRKPPESLRKTLKEAKADVAAIAARVVDSEKFLTDKRIPHPLGLELVVAERMALHAASWRVELLERVVREQGGR